MCILSQYIFVFVYIVPIPKRGAFDEFVASDNTFEVKGTATSVQDEDNEKNDSLLRHIAMTGGCGYDLGEGSDKKKHKDDRHDVYFLSPTMKWNGNIRDQVENLVLAIGANEFGSFISIGLLRVGNRVTLARRYLIDEDPRVNWDIDDLKKAVLDQGTVAEEGLKLIIPPWHCNVLHAAAKVSNKRQKKAEAKEE